MKEGAKRWCFILLIPFFLAIGHDLYANYYLNLEQKTRLEAFEIDPTAYQGSDLGYLFMKYTPEALETTRNAMGEEQWRRWVDPILRLYTFVIALVPAIIFFIWLIVSRLVDTVMGGSSTTGGKKVTHDQFSNPSRGKGQVRYTRR